MNAAPSDPKPTVQLVIERDEDFSLVLEALEELSAGTGTSYTERMLAITGKSALEAIRTRLAAAQKRYEAAEAERDELANWIKRIRGQAESAMASLHGEKSEADLEVAPTA